MLLLNKIQTSGLVLDWLCDILCLNFLSSTDAPEVKVLEKAVRFCSSNIILNKKASVRKVVQCCSWTGKLTGEDCEGCYGSSVHLVRDIRDRFFKTNVFEDNVQRYFAGIHL